MRSWVIVNLDFGGPYPNGHYNLVMVDHRYLVVEEVHNTFFKETRIKLNEIFTTYRTPRKILTDNGPPFQSKVFVEDNPFKPTSKWRIRIMNENAK